jgi:hypothetical protein
MQGKQTENSKGRIVHVRKIGNRGSCIGIRLTSEPLTGEILGQVGTNTAPYLEELLTR